jgi:predicted DsbA family dithiol-disulfide isomerase
MESVMVKTFVRVDIISDVMCPWCLIGWLKFQKVLERYSPQIAFDVHWRSFELNPDMPEDGVNAAEYLGRRYGLTPEQGRGNRQKIADTAKELGFQMNWGADFRLRNTFDAHRLLAWAEAVDDADGADRGGRQTALKMALFRAHFSEEADVNSHDVLIAAAVSGGLDGTKAQNILNSDLYCDVVRAEEAYWRDNGISGVPAIILNEKMMIPGAQDPDVYMRVIDRKILGLG